MTGSQKKILIIEDDPSISKMISSRLEKEGFQMVAAMDGEEGFQKIQTESPDLIILDIMLPKRDGFWVLEEMKVSAEARKDIPVVVLSNLGQPKDIDLAMKLGAKEYLVKTDFSLAKLMDKVKKHLQK